MIGTAAFARKKNYERTKIALFKNRRDSTSKIIRGVVIDVNAKREAIFCPWSVHDACFPPSSLKRQFKLLAVAPLPIALAVPLEPFGFRATASELFRK